jgi:NitT/TauT family transport system permease protein
MTDIVEARQAAPMIRQRRFPFRIHRAAAAILPPALFCLLLLAGWQAMAAAMHSPLLPGIGEIAGEIVRISAGGLALQQIAITLLRIVLGFAAAALTGLMVGIVAARSDFMRRFFDPAVVLGLTVPGLVWALLCVIWFGVGLGAPVASIALGVAPAFALQVTQGMQSVDADIREMAHVFRLSRRDKLQHIWFPSLIPYLMSGTRLGLSLAWKVIVLVELFGLSNGVGYQLNSEFSSQNVAGVLAWTIVFWLVMTVIEYGLLRFLEDRLTRWKRTTRL